MFWCFYEDFIWFCLKYSLKSQGISKASAPISFAFRRLQRPRQERWERGIMCINVDWFIEQLKSMTITYSQVSRTLGQGQETPHHEFQSDLWSTFHNCPTCPEYSEVLKRPAGKKWRNEAERVDFGLRIMKFTWKANVSSLQSCLMQVRKRAWTHRDSVRHCGMRNSWALYKPNLEPLSKK